MLTFTIQMAPIDTPLANGDTSALGHMWYTLDDGSGNPPLSFGFPPLDNTTGIRRMLGSGDVYDSDDILYLNTDPTKPSSS